MCSSCLTRGKGIANAFSCPATPCPTAFFPSGRQLLSEAFLGHAPLLRGPHPPTVLDRAPFCPARCPALFLATPHSVLDHAPLCPETHPAMSWATPALSLTAPHSVLDHAPLCPWPVPASLRGAKTGSGLPPHRAPAAPAPLADIYLWCPPHHGAPLSEKADVRLTKEQQSPSQ